MRLLRLSREDREVATEDQENQVAEKGKLQGGIGQDVSTSCHFR